MYGCESWTLKKAEHWRTDAFELWCWRRLLRVPERRSNQSILKETSPEYSLEELMLKLKLQYFGHLMRRTDSFEKTSYWERLKAEGEGHGRGWDGSMASLTQWTWVWVDSGSWYGQGGLVCCSPWGLKSQTRQSNWTEFSLVKSILYKGTTQYLWVLWELLKFILVCTQFTANKSPM